VTKIAITPNASGTGTFTIAAPNSSSSRTFTLPDETGTVLTSVSDIDATKLTGDVAAARITNALNATGSAPIYACRAWVNFNGTGTVAIREDGNVSSITDNGTGDYTVNFTTAMPDANYCVMALGFASAADSTTLRGVHQKGTPTTSGVRLVFMNGINNSTYDGEYCTVAVFR
jgi:hypothetical protein